MKKRWKAVIESEWLGYTKTFRFKCSAKAWVKRALKQEFCKGYLLASWPNRTIVIANTLADKTYPDRQKSCFIKHEL